MIESHAWRERTQSLGEEIANAVSHGVGLLAAMAGAPVVVFAAFQRGGASGILGASVFAAAMVLLYLASTLSHALPSNRAKRLFENLDKMAIYLLIAGTYTPFTLGVLRGAWGWTLFGFVWGMAAAGVVLKTAGRAWSPKISMYLYFVMGWFALIAIKPMWLRVPPWGFFWIFAGGLAYMTGVGFFAARRIPYNHLIWHL
ncbi:MAG: hemolysin III family protein, partial [Nitrospinota bacterium]|nr:hemolysin III family protein [Nitrospinota bacterium]